jgi:hypothetical protein
MATNNRVLVQIRASTLDSDAANSNDIDLGPYVNAGKRQVVGVWSMFNINAAASDTDYTIDNKFQEAATTVDSDFSDITGGGFTQVTAVTGVGFQSIVFPVTKRYLRCYETLGGTAVSFFSSTAVLVEPRFDT